MHHMVKPRPSLTHYNADTLLPCQRLKKKKKKSISTDSDSRSTIQNAGLMENLHTREALEPSESP